MRILILTFFLLILAACSSQHYVSEKEKHHTLPDNFDKYNHEYYRTYTPAGLYPKNLCDKGFEGYAIIEFDIDEQGKTLNHKVVESDAKAQFGKLTIRRVKGMLYEPRTVGGTPLPVKGVRTRAKYCVDTCRNPDNDCEHRSIACH